MMLLLPSSTNANGRSDSNCQRNFTILSILLGTDAFLRGTVVTKAPLRVQFSPALGGRGWERVKAEASPRLY